MTMHTPPRQRLAAALLTMWPMWPRLRRRLGLVVRALLDRIDAGAGLDRMIASKDAKMANVPDPIAADPDSKPRQPFDTGGTVGLPDSGFAKMTWRQRARLVPTMVGLLVGMTRGGHYYDRPVPRRPSPATPQLLATIDEVARMHGATDLAYVRDVARLEIFADQAIPAPHALVFIVEMDRDQIDTAPSYAAFHEVARGYRRLGEASNALTDLLREHGHAAYPGTALGGLTDYVALAERAGLGAIGWHGLLISPHGGSRLRINTVYTDATGLPERPHGEHDWVREVCAQCQNCVRSCPPAAILTEPEQRFAGGLTSIDKPACNEYFSANHGCAVCVKVCPFSTHGYDAVRRGHDAAAEAVGAGRRLPLLVGRQVGS